MASSAVSTAPRPRPSADPAFKHPADVLNASQKSPKPPHKRSKSSSHNVNDPLHNLRAVFRAHLPRSWNNKALKSLAIEFYSVAVGFTAGTRIRDYPLTSEQTNELAVSLCSAVNTTDLLLILDEATAQLFVVHTHMLMARLEAFPAEETTNFVHLRKGSLTQVPAAEVTYFDGPFQIIKDFLRKSTAQILVTSSSFGWSSTEASVYMVSFGDWLMGQPIVIVADPQTDNAEFWRTQASCYRLSLQVEGHDPENDHVFESCKIPPGLFPDQVLSSGDPKDMASLAAIQDRVQSCMFERLNSNEAAAALWLDLVCSTETCTFQ